MGGQALPDLRNIRVNPRVEVLNDEAISGTARRRARLAVKGLLCGL